MTPVPNQDVHAAIYCRLSNEDRDNLESNSIKTQKLIIESYCRRQGWEIYDTYIDDGYSGTDFERPAFKRMYNDIVDGKINVVITKDLSRLGRNYILTGYYYQVFFPHAGVRYIAINDKIDTQAENNDTTMAAFKNILNDFYSKAISKNIKAARLARLENKINMDGRAPYGYIFNSEHVLVPDPNYAQIVKWIFNEYILNPNMARIASILNDKGIPSPSCRLLDWKAYQDGKISTKWDRSAPCDILSNSAYMGALTLRKTIRLGPYSHKRINVPLSEQTIFYDCHEALIPREIWEKAYQIRQERSFAIKNHYGKNIFSGFLYCSHCGNALRMDGKIITYCFCKCWPLTEKRSDRNLHIEVIARKLIHDIKILAELCENDEAYAFAFIKQCLSEKDTRYCTDLELEIYKGQVRIDTLKTKISRFYEYSANQPFTEKQNAAILSALETSLKNEIKNLEYCKANYSVPPSEQDISEFIRKVRRYGYIQDIERDVIEELIDKIFISKKENSTQYQRGRITVKFKHIGVLTIPLESTEN